MIVITKIFWLYQSFLYISTQGTSIYNFQPLTLFLHNQAIIVEAHHITHLCRKFDNKSCECEEKSSNFHGKKKSPKKNSIIIQFNYEKKQEALNKSRSVRIKTNNDTLTLRHLENSNNNGDVL